jgi:hypothetical protein
VNTQTGEDLLLAANDQPFRFPAAFTFVVRSFTVLDGIGKSLDPRFDISEIAAPYARELLLEGQPQVRLFVVGGGLGRASARASCVLPCLVGFRPMRLARCA